MEFGNGIENIKSLFKDPFMDNESSLSDSSFLNNNVPDGDVMDAYRKKLYLEGLDEVIEDSDLELGEEIFQPREETKKTGITGILKKPLLSYEHNKQMTQSILLKDDEDEFIERRRSMSPVRSAKKVISGDSKSSQRGKKKRMSTKSQVFVKQSLLMNSPEKRSIKRSMSVSFENESERKVQRTLDYYSPKKKTQIEEIEDDDDTENKIVSGIGFSTNILSSNKDNLSDLKTQETQQLYPYQSLNSQAENDEQEIIMSPVMSNILEHEDMEKIENNDNTSEGEIISSIGVSQILQSVQQNKIELPDDVLFEQVKVTPKSTKMYLAYHENSMCFYPCTILNCSDQTCVVKNDRLEMDWTCKKSDLYFYDLKVNTEVHYDRKMYKIVQKERFIDNNDDDIIKTDHLDNYSYELLNLEGKHVNVQVDLIYLDLDDFCKVEDQLLKYQQYAEKRTRSTHENPPTTLNSLKNFVFHFSDFDKEKEKEYTRLITNNGGEVVARNEDIFEDKIKILGDSKLELVGIDKEKIPILLIENSNYRVTKKLIEYMILGWPIMRYDVVDRIMRGIDLKKNTRDFEEIMTDFGVIKNYQFNRFVMNFYGNKDNMLLDSTSLQYKRGLRLKIKRSNEASKFEKIAGILLECEEFKVDLNDIKYILFYT